jgi:AAA15 family ATPase/GTPase
MRAELTIKNYRCFPDETPLEFEIGDGFTAFVGVNNSGKSAILRVFYEFRGLFQALQDPTFLPATFGDSGLVLFWACWQT